jgi:hypothetical protein
VLRAQLSPGKNFFANEQADLPFIHLNVMASGNAHPCCISPIPLTDADGSPLNTRTAWFDEMWKSDALCCRPIEEAASRHPLAIARPYCDRYLCALFER